MYQQLKEKLVSYGLAIHNRRQENRRRLAAIRAIKEDEIRGGQVWTSIANGADYQVLFLTNLYTDGHIQVVYSRHWAYISSMPLEDFFEQFTHNRSVDNTLASAHDDLMAMAHNMRNDGRIRKPEEGEYWTRIDRIPDGFDEERHPKFRSSPVTVEVHGIVEQSPSQPFVLFKEGGERKVLNMYMFLNFYSPEGEANDAV
ncbi:hypothetical protein pEaSNUABM28_00037 [Erwinia phage pEa_SNUABM_28]|uniref:Uncharacterized protein n=1 Tax=Erwinia phage pEa_SNUABM_16 TaxID=2869544 RepID=A0AAE8XPM0_9CAUD|nr:hypothetical protein MPK64_gp036 [Erwinia phage pEa_SNUABM_16]QZE58594.1 hypothetical protein pEaSNUABM28_00037 [Erwinia phage pEa_SNUABM_28]QZE58939.1 hypothetical protein pEaSNUABM18_00036 [Erwinia phage pEa_SNUABM_18]UAW96180.1 hypothetical protein pEaSNUABM16_00036 [Erwinia phage pEa_SNUABM_16]